MSAKKIKIGQKTVDNFEILLKKMGGQAWLLIYEKKVQ